MISETHAVILVLEVTVIQEKSQDHLENSIRDS